MPFVDTKQLIILKWLTAHLEALDGLDVQEHIRDSNENDIPALNDDGTPKLVQVSLAGRVYRGRTKFGDEMGAAPFMSILEGRKPDENPNPVGYSRAIRDETWHILIQGFMEDDINNPLDNLYRFKGMVEQRLSMIMEVTSMDDPRYPEIHRMGGLILDMTVGPGLVRPFNMETGGAEAFFLPIAIQFVMNTADPFSVA